MQVWASACCTRILDERRAQGAVDTGFSPVSAGESGGPVGAALGEDGASHWYQKLELADDTVSSGMFPGSAGAGAE